MARMGKWEPLRHRGKGVTGLTRGWMANGKLQMADGNFEARRDEAAADLRGGWIEIKSKSKSKKGNSYAAAVRRTAVESRAA
jgi:hypothetical protein